MQREPRSTVPARRAAVVLGVLATLLLASTTACGSDAPTTELAEDPADVTVPGPRPTAPDPDETSGLTASGDELIDQLEQVSEETDLCRVLTGEAFGTLLAEDVDVAGLVTSPAGVTQLFTLVDRTFAQMVAISPPAVRPAMSIIDQVWTRLASLSTGTVEAQQRASELLTDPEVVEATRTVVTWAALNCPGAAATLGGGAAG
jgi:hypothetical protein